MKQSIKADQRLFDRGGIKGVGVKHPLRNQPLLASLGNDTKMGFPLCYAPCAEQWQLVDGADDRDNKSRSQHLDDGQYAEPSFAGPKAVLAYLSRYTHRVAISNRRLIKADAYGVTFTYKDYRIEGPGRHKTMALATHEFIRRFLMHVLPKGFHRIRHYGLLANGNRAAMVARARELLAMAPREKEPGDEQTAKPAMPDVLPCPCPRCGGRMIVIEVIARSCQPGYRSPLVPIIRLDTS